MSRSTPDCLKCAGACCEDLVFPVDGLSPATRDFLVIRNGDPVQLTFTAKGIALPCRCRHLTTKGLCGIYEDRPLVCEAYVAGGEACLETLKRRRPVERRWILGEKP